MNREGIIRMAREAGFYTMQGSKGELYALSYQHMEKFAALVAAAEREACAKVAERFEPIEKQDYVEYASAAIRARGSV